MREIRTLGLMRRGLETSLWWRHWGTPMRKRGATDQRNLKAPRQSSTLLANERVVQERSRESILAPNLAVNIARYRSKRRTGVSVGRAIELRKTLEQGADSVLSGRKAKRQAALHRELSVGPA